MREREGEKRTNFELRRLYITSGQFRPEKFTGRAGRARNTNRESELSRQKKTTTTTGRTKKKRKKGSSSNGRVLRPRTHTGPRRRCQDDGGTQKRAPEPYIFRRARDPMQFASAPALWTRGRAREKRGRGIWGEGRHVNGLYSFGIFRNVDEPAHAASTAYV